MGRRTSLYQRLVCLVILDAKAFRNKRSAGCDFAFHQGWAGHAGKSVGVRIPCQSASIAESSVSLLPSYRGAPQPPGV